MCALSELFAFFAPGHLTRVVVARLGVDTNEAERRLRPLVIARTVSDGTRSDQAADTRLDLASVFQTWHAHGLKPLRGLLLLAPLWVTPTPSDYGNAPS